MVIGKIDGFFHKINKILDNSKFQQENGMEINKLMLD